MPSRSSATGYGALSGSGTKAERTARHDDWMKEQPSVQERLMSNAKSKDRKSSMQKAIGGFDKKWHSSTAR
ncbi:hypothetical protein CGCF415_v010206 [Colletotrichum fructicola]|uniref:Uncharacterized protein n=2 Tax=Colletotrichum gloeosporioides species complex TaxID=2707338 RepID=A0A7J6J502_COLFN|nr:uncharacterized protein CGMCC3_g8318 [Colletotrichum fructicola]KAF4484910.1 hypothetical protein CGGC5_v007276 [Colletotrichum fructicola Nara gc5]KAF4853600.1 hypothetical protein CGCSCA4_v002262 [Colletotrichum siamense]KAE9575686.1 hypothetical protein CGMCC3_g8318 [Colletotrichum fructicola]KAF4411389.1 hypothetical protein CFRS1_v006411 [Colletotrichum fructicola]KAF4864013.1 hypothetical protein CGCSCA2_v002397 [Colletotrichum siamense]